MRTSYMRGYEQILLALIGVLTLPGCTAADGGSRRNADNSVAGAGNRDAGGNPSSADSSAGSSGSSGQGTQCTPADQSQVAFRVLTRLNRAEYDNTVQDLLGDTTHAALSALPADFGDGAFDNNAAALSIDPSLSQAFVQLAEALAENALAVGSPGRGLLLTCSTTDEACAKQIGSDFAVRAWRRPLQSGELDRLLSLYTSARTAGFSFEQGVQTMVEGALLSPSFLFRPELDAVVDSQTVHALGPYELSSRLSYFLWSSMPDAALQASAASGELMTPAGLQAQLARMWASPKAEAFFERFPGQWLHTLNITIGKQPAPEVFPAFNATLQAAMQGETAHFMRELMTTDSDIMTMLDAKFTYLNAPLAQFYGIPGQFTDDFVRVDLTGNSQRGGILTQAAFLTVTSPPERTSPVMRGQWVLARVLNAPPPPPPNNIPSIDAQASATPQTMRQKMTAHAANPACAGCHAVMDPIGFGLENYDGIGQWRSTDNGIQVDASGVLDSDKTFDGALQLEQILKTDVRVPRAIVQYLLSYALGRELSTADRCLLDDVTSAFQTVDKNRMQALVKRIATLPVMQSRRGAP